MAENNGEVIEVVEKTPEEMVAEMRATMVPKEEAEKWQNKYNTLFKDYVSGKSTQVEQVKEPTKEELKAEYENTVKYLGNTKIHKTNLEHAKALMKIREYRLENGESDIFLPTSGMPTQEDVKLAESTAELMQYAIDNCDDSDSVYNAIINDHLRDNQKIINRR